MQRIIVLSFLILTLALSAHAESRYVTDQLIIALRPAQDDTSLPLEYLTTGMQVEVVKDYGSFLKIKSPTGTVGFARSKYFVPTPPERTIEATSAVQEQLTAAQQRISELSAEVEQLKSTPAVLATPEKSQELEKSRAEITTLQQERDQLLQEVAKLKETAKEKGLLPDLTDISQLQWFLAGAAILLLGWFAGKSSRSKRRY
ncbi:MAG: TIGR04211 family SH3 domain-containing protein [Deltaproteobacteria bacterium HGW-Deltaproteobacteria-4]|nr:MAG: TIGR04211 family SH3 domain-containing protein [Deltaproteobacteria bacterium HGW-Deltaproteobacteria-4]